MFCDKHREKLIRHGLLHLYLRKSGWWQQRRVRDSRVARRLYLESLEANPVAPLTYVLLLATYVPMPCLDMMARCKQFVVRLLRLGPQPHFVRVCRSPGVGDEAPPERAQGFGSIMTADAFPFVSVVVPVRNEARFIADLCRSIFAQDYPADRFEVIVADGMSTDGTREVLARLQAEHSSLVVVENPGRIVSTGLNIAVARSRGDIIVRIDGHALDRGRFRDTKCGAAGGASRGLERGRTNPACWHHYLWASSSCRHVASAGRGERPASIPRVRRVRRGRAVSGDQAMGVRSHRDVRRAAHSQSGRRVQLPDPSRGWEDLCFASRAVFLFGARTDRAAVQAVFSIRLLARSRSWKSIDAQPRSASWHQRSST